MTQFKDKQMNHLYSICVGSAKGKDQSRSYLTERYYFSNPVSKGDYIVINNITVEVLEVIHYSSAHFGNYPHSCLEVCSDERLEESPEES